MFRKDVFGHFLFVKRFVITLIGLYTYNRLKIYNRLSVKGIENLDGLPEKGVLFVSNHQTYFADVIAIMHIFCSFSRGNRDKLPNIWYLFRPLTRVYFIAAEETMKDGILPKLFALAGSVNIKRTWREAGKDVNRQVDMRDITKIKQAIENGWTLSFPQGTTKPFVPGRKGTAHIIKTVQPVVVPVVINGFRRAFDKKGLRLKKTGVNLSVEFKAPLHFDDGMSNEEILEKVMDAIEQSERFRKKPDHPVITETHGGR